MSFFEAFLSRLATLLLLKALRCFHHSTGLVRVSFRVCAIIVPVQRKA